MIDFKTEKFSGPLGLLLSMIESEEMDITEIALAKIADDYVEYIRSSADIDPDEMADFLVIAAKLLLIKSKALLPYLYTAEDEQEVDDLERQLKMYKEFVVASQKIKEIIAEKKFLFLPPLPKNRRQQFNLPVFTAPAKIDINLLHEVFLNLLAALEKLKEEKLPELRLESKISIDEKILQIKKMILDKARVNFSKILEKAENKTEIIVSFLAVLELAKQKELVFEQAELFGEINIARNDHYQEHHQELTEHNLKESA
ncbi:segregation/condensation protein A [Candidatus Falkowbacteria bacterium]|jgi:segregation and condensation protein A|nr:segregation/condensation protein A [Candidatus Falkowbacteria bacterium]